MHIAIDASRLAVSQRTGTESYTAELLAALAQLDRRNQYTLYVNSMPQRLPPLGMNWRLRQIPAPRMWTHTRFASALRLDAPDVAFIPAHVLPIVPPKRSVVTIHDLGYEYFPDSHTRQQRLYLRWSTRWSARQATQIIAISEATKRDLIKFTGINSDKISVVYHGVNPRFQPHDPNISRAVAKKYDLDGEYVLFISTIQPRKNLVRLIDAYAIARRITPDLPPLAIGGKIGWLADKIKQQAAEYNISKHVRFLGYVADDDLPALVSGASLYVLPSLYEGFGMTVLEAMASGTPVITSNTSSLPEVAGDAALLVDPLDTMQIAQTLHEAWTNTSLRDDLRQRGLAWSSKWTWRRCAEQTLAVLENVGRT